MTTVATHSNVKPSLTETQRRPLCMGFMLLVGLVVAGCSSDSKASAPTAGAATTTAQTTVATVAPTTDQTTAPPTTLAGPRPLPLIDVLAGTYRIDTFAVPYDIKVVEDWARIASNEKLMWVGRGANASTEFLVTSDVMKGATPQEVLDGFCSDVGVHFVALPVTTLLGQPAVQQEADLINGCTSPGQVDVDSANWEISAGNTTRVIAAEVNGTIVVVVADAPTADWAAVTPVIEAMIASMTPVG